jgi:hypothetical protein
MPDTVMTQESLWALILVPLLIVLLLVGAWLLRRLARWKDFDLGEERWMVTTGAWICLIGALLSAVGLWWGMYPWKWEYHQWTPVAGEVRTVDSRLIGGDGSMQDKFVVTFVGNPQQYGVYDTRAASLRAGDHLTIACVRRWQWSGTHGYDCNFIRMESNR